MLASCMNQSFSQTDYAGYPVYFEKEMAEHPTACQFNYVTPYSVPDSVMKAIGWKGESVVLIIADHSPEVNRNLKHLAQEFKPEDFQLISSSNTSEWDNWHSCFFFLNPYNQSIKLIIHSMKPFSYARTSSTDSR